MGAKSTREQLEIIWEATESCQVQTETAKELFRKYDIDESGHLSGFEWSNLMEALSQFIFEKGGEKGNLGEIRAYVNDKMDLNHDGKISKEEYYQTIYSVLQSLSLDKKSL